MSSQKNRGRENFRVPQLVIPLPVWQKMMSYILNCPYEINGFGFVSKVNDVIYVNDVFILEQVVTAGSVETVQEALDAFVGDLARNGGDPGSIKFQWHSHVQMAAWFSDTDLDNIARWPGDWLVSVVANQRGEYCCQLDVPRPVRLTIPLQPLIPMELPLELGQATRADIAQLVRQPRRIFTGTKSAPLVPDNSAPLWGHPDDYDMFDSEVPH